MKGVLSFSNRYSSDVAYLRSHPVGRAHHGVPLLVLLDVGTEPEVRDLHLAVHPQQDVVRLKSGGFFNSKEYYVLRNDETASAVPWSSIFYLDVPVENTLGVEVIYSLETLERHHRYQCLLHHCFCHHIGQRAALHKLHHHKQMHIHHESLNRKLESN